MPFLFPDFHRFGVWSLEKNLVHPLCPPHLSRSALCYFTGYHISGSFDSPILANFLRQQTDDPNLTILSVHSLMLKTVKKYGKIPAGYTPGMPITDAWFRNDMANEFEKASRHLQENDLYDVLIIDEGQDILNLNYMSALDRILIGGFAEGIWRIFCDP